MRLLTRHDAFKVDRFLDVGCVLGDVAQGLATEDEVAAIVTALDEFAAMPGAVATLPRTSRVSGRAFT